MGAPIWNAYGISNEMRLGMREGLLAAAIGLAILLAACGDDGGKAPEATSSPADGAEVTVTAEASPGAAATVDPGHAATATATVSELAGTIAFVSLRDGNSEIYATNADSGPSNLTNNPASDGGPDWSPDGSRIAFHSNREGNLDIYVMNDDGSELTRLTDDAGDDSEPTWSSDGEQIAFVSQRDGNPEIYVMNTAGSRQTNLTNDEESDTGPAWSPDGSAI